MTRIKRDATHEFPPLRAVLVERVGARRVFVADHPVAVTVYPAGGREFVKLEASHLLPPGNRRYAWWVMIGGAVFQQREIHCTRIVFKGGLEARFVDYRLHTSREHFELLVANACGKA